MAIVKILNIATLNHIDKASDYIQNAEKTEQCEYVTGYACEPSTASSEFLETKLIAQRHQRRPKTGSKPHEAYHIIQSFAPGEVTAEQAHEIGRKLANEFLEGRFEYVIATHVDKDHVHNHILVNSVSFYDHKKLYTAPYKTIAKLRDINDRLALENDLSVIEHPGKLGYSYKEWDERRQGTSWKAEIRKRLNFILARCTSYEEFQRYCAELQVYFNDTGRNTQYRLPGQERNVRGDTLDKDGGKYTAEGIKKICEENLSRRNEIAAVLKEVIPNCTDMTELTEELFRHGISLRETYQGMCWTMDGTKRTEHELGAGFSKSALMGGMACGRYEPEQSDRDINAEWEDREATVSSNDTIAVMIPPTMILKIGLNGLLVETEDEEQMFLSNHLLDYDESSDRYIFHVQPKQAYSLVPEKLNPDLRISEQQSDKQVRGEMLLRKMELANGVVPTQVEVSGKNIVSMSEKGVSLSLPEDGIPRLFIPAEFVTADRRTGTVKINLYPNWNYSFRTDRGYESITGNKLADYLSNTEMQPQAQMQRRIAAVERSETRARVHRLNDILWTLRNEGIEQNNDFTIAMEGLRGKADAVKSSIATCQHRVVQYQQVAKWLNTVQTYRELSDTRDRISPWRRKRFEIEHQTELNAYDHSLEQLRSYNISEDLDVDKVIAMIDQQKEQIADLQREQDSVELRMKKLAEAQQEVQHRQHRQADRRKDMEL